MMKLDENDNRNFLEGSGDAASKHRQHASPNDALLIDNGGAAPLDAVPLLSCSAFSHWLAAQTRGGSRLSALFAVPVADGRSLER